jgi:serine/threonine protein kinase
MLLKVRQLQKDLEICTHPELVQSGYIPEVCGYGMLDDLPFVVMEMASGGSLLQMLATDHEWSVRIEILQQVACAVKILHQNQIIHGDIKLENVLIFTHSSHILQAKLSDFSHSTYEVGSIPPTTSYRYFGTWPILPPEVWNESGNINGESCDIWAYSVLLWRVCQYREDRLLDYLNFVPHSDDATCELDVNSQIKMLEEARRTLVELLKSSETVDAVHQDEVVSIFTQSFQSNPHRRCSAHELCDRLIAITTDDISTDLDAAVSALSLRELDSAASTDTIVDNHKGWAAEDQYSSAETRITTWKAFETTVPMAIVSLI